MSLHTLAELTADFVVYRNLEPWDDRVPGIARAWREMGLNGAQVVRKRDPLYPQAAAWILRQCHRIHAPHETPEALYFIGDTLGNDGHAFHRLAHYTTWSGAAFIGSEARDDDAKITWHGDICEGNRWEHLAVWLQTLVAKDQILDERAIAVVDIDKTVLGARGRNHIPIDHARLVALQQTVLQTLGEDTDRSAFSDIYHQLNHPRYHDLTGDNQDYLAYISMMVGAGVMSLQTLQRLHDAEQMNSFAEFMQHSQSRLQMLPAPLAEMHTTVQQAYAAEDPTPFKDFRRNEYMATVLAMGQLPDDFPADRRLGEEICLTREVWDACRWLQRRGVLIVAMSDKPDEACGPSEEWQREGYLPIHRTPTHLIGEPLSLAGD